MKLFVHSFYNCLLKLPVRQRGMSIVSIPVACLLMSLMTFAWLKASLAEDDRWVLHTQQVRLETKKLLTALLNAETGMRGYGLTQREEFLEPYYQAIATIPTSLDTLYNLVDDNPKQQERVVEIRGLIDQSLSLTQQKITLKRQLQDRDGRSEVVIPAASLYEWLEEGKATMDTIRAHIDEFAEEEEYLLEQRQQHQELYRQITWIVICLSATIGTLSGLLANALFRKLEQDLADKQMSLEQSNRQLQQAYEQLQRFTANASHELRTPLSSILSNAQVALMAPPEDITASQHRLEKIVSLTKSMSGLIKDLLFLARHEGLLTREVLKPVELGELLRSLIEEWTLQAKAQHLFLESQLPLQPVRVEADSNLLRQAIVNLLSNAYRYTPCGGCVELRLVCQRERALIQVIDTGIGIPPEALPHIFERFYRVDASRSKAKGGIGLGLAIAQQIVQAHRGELTVKSTVGKGSIFEIDLPRL